MIIGRASSIVWRIFSPPGTSPSPVLPALSFMITILRVKNGPCAPDRLSSMLSCPATGITCNSVTVGAPLTFCCNEFKLTSRFDENPGGFFCLTARNLIPANNYGLFFHAFLLIFIICRRTTCYAV